MNVDSPAPALSRREGSAGGRAWGSTPLVSLVHQQDLHEVREQAVGRFGGHMVLYVWPRFEYTLHSGSVGECS